MDECAQLRAELDRDFPNVDYTEDADNAVMLKALLFAARARQKHMQQRAPAKQPDPKKARLAQPIAAMAGEALLTPMTQQMMHSNPQRPPLKPQPTGDEFRYACIRVY